jgi:hypothetical protein
MMEQAQALSDAQVEALEFVLSMAANVFLTRAQEDDVEETDMEHDFPELNSPALLQEAHDKVVTLAMKSDALKNMKTH